MEFPRQLDVTPWHDIILRYWSCPLWQSGAYYLASLTWVLTRSDWPFPWSKTHCSYYSWIHNTSLWCLYRSSARSDFGFSIPNYGIHTRWNSVGILRPLLWFKNLGIRRSPSWAPAYHWWIWAYAARHEGRMGDGSGWWAAVLAPSREQGRTVCATAQSTDWGSYISTILDFSHSRLGWKWTECIDKGWLREFERKEKKIGNLLE